MAVGNVTGLRCVTCGARYDYGEISYTCPKCGLAGILDVEYDYDGARAGLSETLSGADRTVWRYLPLLPIDPGWARPHLELGPTPLVECPALAEELGVRRFRIKDDARTPTSSSKDRASAVAVIRARAEGHEVVGCASTGNAAVSLAGWAAAAGLEAIIFVPASAPQAKIAQLAIYGARVLLVEDDYAATWHLAQEAAREIGFYNRNCAVNPFLVEGKKTLGLELGEQTRDDPATVVSMSVGDGCSIAGLWKGLDEMATVGVLPARPRLLGVQAEGASGLVAAWAAGQVGPVTAPAETLADSISVGEPRNPVKALRAVQASEGHMVAVSDQAIVEAIKDLATSSGVFAEPAAAAPLAGIRRARQEGILRQEDSVVHVVTGSGLKDIRAAMSVAPRPRRVAPSLDAVREVLS